MAALVSFTLALHGDNVNIDAATDLVVFAVTRSNGEGGSSTATFGGTALSVATNSNEWVQIYYRLAPASGSQQILFSATNDISEIFVGQYSGVSEFDAAGQGSVSNHSVAISRGGVITFAMAATVGPYTPTAATTERYDSGGDYYGDSIQASSGTYSVGTSTATFPDSAYAAFLDEEEEEGGEVDLGPVALSAGSASLSSSVLRARSLTGTLAAQSASISTNLSRGRTLTGTLAAASASIASSVSRGRTVTTSLSAQSASLLAEIAVEGNRTLTVTLTAQSATLNANLHRYQLVGRNPGGEQRITITGRGDNTISTLQSNQTLRLSASGDSVITTTANGQQTIEES